MIGKEFGKILRINMSNELRWVEKNKDLLETGGYNFKYEIKNIRLSSSEYCWIAFLYDQRGIAFQASCSTPEFGKKFCQSHHDTIHNVIKKAITDDHLDKLWNPPEPFTKFDPRTGAYNP